MLVFLMGAGILAAAMSTADSRTLGPGWSRLIHPHGGRLARLFQAGLLLIGGQCALVIWWARSQSLRDFKGRYHVWLWAAIGLMFAAGGLAGQWHWAWSDTVCWLWSARFPQRDVLCWMVPALIVAGILWRKLRADMRDCTTSSLLLWLAAGASLGACLFRLGIDRTGWDVPTRQFSGACLQMLTCTALFVSFLVHARFVIHFSAEPPAHRPSLWARCFEGLKFLLSKLPKPKRKLRFAWKRKTDQVSENTAAKPNGQPASRKTAATNPPPSSSGKDAKTVERPTKSAVKTGTAKTPAKPRRSGPGITGNEASRRQSRQNPGPKIHR